MMNSNSASEIRYSTFSSQSENRMRRNRNLNRYLSSSSAMGPVSISFVLIIIVGILALLYLTQITKTTVYGYQVNNLSTERADLLSRNQELQVEAARLQAIARIRDSQVARALEADTQTTVVSAQPN